VLLISHDYRGADGDDTCLAPIHAALSAEMGGRLHYPTARHSAAELKAMAGLMDCVVTGRMHLAIAALGMGRPVAGLTYQDKFLGLFGLFEYPSGHLLAPADAKSADKLTHAIENLLDHAHDLAACVALHLPDVRRASARNLDRLVA
jgi:polysaccharide pyruvyl transferase WcaK-like protein